MSDLLHPGALNPVTAADDAVPDGLYGVTVVDGRITGLGAAESDSGSPTITYAQLAKSFTIARNASSGSNWAYIVWTLAHFKYLKLNSFVCDVLSADTYTLSIDGEDVASTVCGAASSGNAFTPGVFAGVGVATPKVLTPGPHIFKLRGTAARTFYYNSSNAPTPTGTYLKLTASPWFGPTVTAAVHGTLNFDAEGDPA